MGSNRSQALVKHVIVIVALNRNISYADNSVLRVEKRAAELKLIDCIKSFNLKRENKFTPIC